MMPSAWADGGTTLVEDGHAVTLHARNATRAAEAQRGLTQAEAVVVGELSSIAETRRLAEQVNDLGRYHAVIHNAGVGYREPRRIETVDGLCHVFAINVLAPYLLTALVTRPDRLVYLPAEPLRRPHRHRASAHSLTAASRGP
ncbi:MAG: SDR family NAD(P)-dependent oxidoreductase [Pseudonocardiaceae bacterium]